MVAPKHTGKKVGNTSSFSCPFYCNLFVLVCMNWAALNHFSFPHFFPKLDRYHQDYYTSERGVCKATNSRTAAKLLNMNLEPPKNEIKSVTRVTGGPASPRKGPPKFKQRQTRQFKSKPPKKGIQG